MKLTRRAFNAVMLAAAASVLPAALPVTASEPEIDIEYYYCPVCHGSGVLWAGDNDPVECPRCEEAAYLEQLER